jgi:hypothetical protein
MQARWLLVALALVLLGVGACGCGRAAPLPGYVKGDGDNDNDSSNHDDRPIRDYGHAASPADARAMRTLVERYYAAAVAGDAGSVCSLVDATSSHTEALIFPEGLVLELIASQVLSGRSCGSVTAMLLESEHRLLVDELATVKVTSVRVGGSNGFALLAFRTMPERVIPVERVGGVWMVRTLLPSLIP